ncbi:MAG: 50S ribosomal protein L17 [Planctomycetes bacterium]|jgi:large subunit ribosomal protein L17|nr:50S ribosomal protein L17 [Planctomycetota bacterium]HON44858.1 50S ribosomal protein L17 [Planctomycetota bacterium]HPY75089.1 50S ribosomal protein L17 [Planctomycetota bacterium]HQB00657.1 50S ribosomal protein L17 [Planctomycetota bacterium]HRU51575.1 50S ribosomal protein L17 [Planctomycetota bacterium]
MRHQNRGRKLGRSSAHRKALARNIIRSLFLHGQIITTISKAKEYAPMAEKLISIAKKAETKVAAMQAAMKDNPEITPEEIKRQADAIRVAQLRFALSKLPDKEVVKKLFYVIAPLFANRNGGYTRIIRLNKRRLGDNTKQAILKLSEELPEASVIEKQKADAIKAYRKERDAKLAAKKKAAK